jgi:hypothetical protein
MWCGVREGYAARQHKLFICPRPTRAASQYLRPQSCMMVPTDLGNGHRNAATTRIGFVLVSTYAWALITICVAIARFAQGHAHKVEIGRDDATIVAATVGRLSIPPCVYGC